MEMPTIRGIAATVTQWFGRQRATVETDPALWFSHLQALPNPDPILRKLGNAELVYNSILADSHVIGDVRSIRGEFRSHNYRVVAGDPEDPRSVEARDLCEAWLRTTQPNNVVDWLEVMWQMASSILSGYRVHEVVWDVKGGSHPLTRGKILPVLVLDRPNRRFKFDAQAQPLLITKNSPLGEACEPYQYAISRHMASATNPYGIALASSCYWWWVFKTGGTKYLVKNAERHGLPWPIARYPMGSQEGEINALEASIQKMIESAYAVVQEGTGIELLVPKNSGGDLPQKVLIDTANREMSKALTGQAMVAELTNVGARAASETALTRQRAINDADRDIPGSGISWIFRWITTFNVGEDVAAPLLEFYKHEPADSTRAETYQLVANMGARPSKKAMLEELAIPEAADDEDALLPSSSRTPKPKQPTGGLDFSRVPGFAFAKAAGLTEEDAARLAAEAADQELAAHVIGPISELLAQYERDGRSLEEFRAALVEFVGRVDDDGLRDVIDLALTFSIQQGAAEVQ